MSTDRALVELSINTIRTLAIDAVQGANSGHPGLPMGAAPMAYLLWQRHLRHNPRNPDWPDRDRFVLSAGHGSMLIYSLLHLTGYDVSLDDLRGFRTLDSKTPGHPECFMTPGVEATTGPLGQGSANSVGMAIAERYLAHRFNRGDRPLVDHYTYALVSDGDIMEGVCAEAASLAGHLRLGKLIWLYDANDVTLDGPASLTFDEDVCKRFEAHGWQVLRIEDGDTDLDAIDRAIAEAKADTTRPSLLWVHTTIGYGSPNKAGTSKAHGSALGADEVRATKENLGWTAEEPMHVPAEVLEHFRSAVDRGETLESRWRDTLAAFRSEHPELAAEWDAAMAGRLPEGWDGDIPGFEPGESIATRAAAGKVENAIAARVPWLIGGDADLGGSTKTIIEGTGTFEGQGGTGRNLRFGVREHAMGSICNGLDYHGGVRPFAATFFVFSDYMRPAVRIAALNRQPVVYVWTHDSVGLGEDGPTHQPIEHLMALRALPNLHLVRPCDANEVAEAWRHAMERTEGPTGLVLTRQKLPTLDREGLGSAAGLKKGAYVLADTDGTPDAIVIASGSEVHPALAARESLAAGGVRVRVVSMPCWELFEAQDAAYRDQVLPPEVEARVSIEAGVTFGWERWVGNRGIALGIDRFGASAPGDVLMEHFGFTSDAVVGAVEKML